MLPSSLLVQESTKLLDRPLSEAFHLLKRSLIIALLTFLVLCSTLTEPTLDDGEVVLKGLDRAAHEVLVEDCWV